MHTDRDNRTESGIFQNYGDLEGQIVHELYRGILHREVDPVGYKEYKEKLLNGQLQISDLIDVLITSEEFRNNDPLSLSVQSGGHELATYSGYLPSDLNVFDKFDTRHVTASPGFLTEWIGSRARITSLWDGCGYLDNIVHPLPVPGDYHCDAIEWIGTLKAVLSASGSFSVMELGAGHGPWLAAASAAARVRGIDDLHLCGVEGDPGRFELLRLNMDDNALTGVDLLLLQGAIGAKAGRVRWPRIPDPRNDSGARPARDGNIDDGQYLDGRNQYEMVEVEVFALDELLMRRPQWDLIHIDIQGTETELCTDCIDQLSKRVRYLVIGTHSRKIDGDLMELFLGRGWVLEHEKPARMLCTPGLPLSRMTTHDGTQVWRNPRFQSEAGAI